MCLFPKLIKNPKYKPNKKNGGHPPFCHDVRTLYVPIGCGECMECLKKKAREWQVRMQEEIRHDRTAKFITLTFTEESLKELAQCVTGDTIEENEIATIAIRRFLERWRKKYGKSVKHWFATELGHNGTERIHLHGLIWTDKSKLEIEERWQYGMIWQGQFVNEKTINYIIKYIHKRDKDHPEFKAKVLTSKGIGKGYFYRNDYKLNKYKEKETKEEYRFKNGTKCSLPIYYRNKIYTEEEREKLWIEKLNEQIRWVGGEKVSVTKGHKNYMELLKYYQKLNRAMGYGEPKNWSDKEYIKRRKDLEDKKDFKEEEKCVKIASEPIEEQIYSSASLMRGNENAWFNEY